MPFQRDGGQRGVERPQFRPGKPQRGRNDRMRHADRQRGRQARCVKNIVKFHKHAFSGCVHEPQCGYRSAALLIPGLGGCGT